MLQPNISLNGHSLPENNNESSVANYKRTAAVFLWACYCQTVFPPFFFQSPHFGGPFCSFTLEWLQLLNESPQPDGVYLPAQTQSEIVWVHPNTPLCQTRPTHSSQLSVWSLIGKQGHYCLTRTWEKKEKKKKKIRFHFSIDGFYEGHFLRIFWTVQSMLSFIKKIYL